MRRNAFSAQALVLAAILLTFPFSSLIAEEQKDLFEGITDSYGEGSSLGILPRFKLNPETGMGSGLKIKSTNPFGLPLMIECANLYTTKRNEQYEGSLATLPSRESRGGAYAILFAGYERIQDLRFFGIGNSTKAGAEGDEAAMEYRAFSGRGTAGWGFSGRYFTAFHLLYKKVRVREGEGDGIPRALERYYDIPGIRGGSTAGLGGSLIRSTRDSQWRPRRGTRFELTEESFPGSMNGKFEYHAFTADARAYRNIFGDYNVLAGRLSWRGTAGDGDRIPWWDLPGAGGRDSLRGFWEGRFRGRSAAVANGEYRFHIVKIAIPLLKYRPRIVLDGNVFCDAARVFTGDDKDPTRDWHWGAGGGFRLITGPNLMGRLDIGFSREIPCAVYFNFGTVF